MAKSQTDPRIEVAKKRHDYVERKIAAIVRRYFIGQKKRVIEALGEFDEVTIDIIPFLFKTEDEHELLVKQVGPILSGAILFGAIDEFVRIFGSEMPVKIEAAPEDVKEPRIGDKLNGSVLIVPMSGPSAPESVAPRIKATQQVITPGDEQSKQKISGDTVRMEVQQYAVPAETSTLAFEPFGIEAEILNFKLPRWMKGRVSEAFQNLMQQQYWRDIQASTNGSIADVVSDAIDEGLSIPNMAERLQETFNGFSKFRAQAIARTETTNALNTGHSASTDGLSSEFPELVKGKEWLAILDNDVRPAHRSLNGVVVSGGNMFDVGGYKAPHPGHPSLPANQRVNCRCTTVSAFDWSVIDDAA